MSRPRRRSADTLALLLGGGVILVLVILAATALIDAAQGNGGSRPSENLTQILATILGGMVGAIAAYLGRSRLERRREPEEPAEPGEPEL